MFLLLVIDPAKKYDPYFNAFLEPNDEENPLFVNSPHFTGYLLMRYSDFEGVTKCLESARERKLAGTGSDDILKSKNNSSIHQPIRNPKSTYFGGRKRRYSMVAQGRFKKEYNGNEILFGVDSNRALGPVPGFGFLIKIANWLDPSLEAGDGSKPHCYTPIISAMNALSVYSYNDDIDMARDGRSLLPSSSDDVNPKTKLNKEETLIAPPTPSSASVGQDDVVNSNELSIGTDELLDCKAWSFGYTDIPENNHLLFKNPNDAKHATSYEKRKRYFGRLDSRLATTISPDNIYCMDFYDAYFDHNSFQLKLPGLSIDAFKYWDGEQKIRYPCMSRDGETIFFVFQFELVPKSEYQ